MTNKKNIGSLFILPGCLILLVFAGINSLFAQTTRYVPGQYSTISAAVTAASNGDTIDVTGTIAENQINVIKNLYFRGHDSSNTIVRCTGSYQSVFSIINNVSPPANITVTISGMTLCNGRYGINLSDANLNLIGCNVTNNTFGGIKVISSINTNYHVSLLNSSISNNTGNSASSQSLGIGVFNGLTGGLMTIDNCNINNNNANNNNVTDFSGGGIYNNNKGNLSINNSNIIYNSLNAGTGSEGGGIYNRGNLTVNNSNINHNSLEAGTGCGGGGIFNAGGMTVNNCTISHNSLDAGTGSDGGGIANGGTLTVNNCTISHNTIYAGNGSEGGGIANGGTLTVNSCTISNNSALYDGSGGGIENYNNATINNSTICFNFINAGTFVGGSGIENRIQLVGAHLYINNSTIAYNRSSGNHSQSYGQGLFSFSYGSTVIKNTILAMNYMSNSANQDCYGPIQSMGYNLVGQVNSGNFNATGDMTGVNPILDTLNNNRGPTLTEALLTGSPAINAGNITNINGDTVLFDQRGFYRGNTIDIGAYEHDGNNCAVFQIPDYVCNQLLYPIIKIQISARPDDSISSFSFSTSGTTNLSEIQNIKLFYTGNNNVFAADSQIGSTISNPGNGFTISENRKLKQGLNYFWLTYTISPTAIVGNVFDATCNQIIFNSTQVIPYDSSPIGSRRKLDIFPDFMVVDSSQCLQGNHFLFTNQSNSQPVAINFTWLFGDDSLSSLTDSVHHSYLNPGSYLVTLRDNACMNTVTQMVIVKPSPQAVFTVNKPVQCFTNNRFLLTNSGKMPQSADTSFYWDFGDMSGDTNFNAVHTFSYPDSFNIRLIASTSLGCSDTQFKSVVVHPSAVAAFSINDTSQCLKWNLFNFTNQTIINDHSKISYLWNFGNGRSDTSTQTTYSYIKDHTYRVSLIAKTNMGCKDTITKSITVFPSPPAGFSVNDSIQCHTGNLFVFTNEMINPQPGTVNYHWDFGDGYSDTFKNTAHSYLLDDTFHVTLISSNDKGCGDTARKQVIVNPSPTADFGVSDTMQCFHDNYFTFINRSSINKGTITFFWDFGNLFTSKVFETSINYANPGNYPVSLSATSGLGCTDSFKRLLHVNPDPVADFSIDDTLQCLSGNKFRFTNNSSILSDTFTSYWNFGDHNDTAYFSPVYSYLNTGNYTIKLLTKTVFGCSDSMSKKVEIFPDAIVQSVTGGENCGPGQLSLFAKAVNGIINWYSTDVGGVLLYQGDTFVTNAGTTYYVEAVNKACASTPRTPVTALIKYVPTITSTTPASRWYPGTVTLKAFASAGTVNWYDTITGGLLLATGTSFTTSILARSKTYYVDATYSGCTTGTRTAIKATILPNSINDLTVQVGVIFYPNPATDVLILEVTGLKEKANLSFIDVQGRVVKSINIQPVSAKFSLQIDLRDLPQGLYLLNLKNDSVFQSGRLVKY